MSRLTTLVALLALVATPATAGTMDVHQALLSKPVLSVILDTPGRMDTLAVEIALSPDEEETLWQLATDERLFDRDLHQAAPDTVEWNAQVAERASKSEAVLRDVTGDRFEDLLSWLQKYFDEDYERATPQPTDSRSCLTYNVYATQYNAYTSWEVAVPDKYVKFAALGWSNAAGYPGSDYEVTLDLDGVTNTVPVGDVGPWNIDDNYWNTTSGDRPRRMFTDLPQGTPEAHAAYYDNYNGGLDQYGRSVSNPAGLDQCLTLAGAMGLAYLENAWMDVTYGWECGNNTPTDDEDNDGWTVDDGDCDDHNAYTYPGAPEIADHLDNDCDGHVDENTDNHDDDGDGYSEADGDCDDANPHIHPGALEIQDNLDNDCDGHVDSAPVQGPTVSVCIDAGHGDFDPGAVGLGLQEKDINLTTALALRGWMLADNLDTHGGGNWDVYMTRDTDEFIALTARADYANSLGVDYFLSIHANAGGGNGTETYAYASGTTADDLAHEVNDAVVQHLGTFDRGVKYSSFTVLVKTAMPAELHEIAFIDVWSGNAELMSDDDNLVTVAKAHLYALQRMVGLPTYTPNGGVPLNMTQDGSGPDGGHDPGGERGWASACSVRPGSPASAGLVLSALALAVAIARRRTR